MSPKEVGRRLIDGVWVTDVRDENGGTPGSANALTLLGPFPVAFNTAGFVNGLDNGVPTLDIPAGSVVEAFSIVTSPFAGDDPTDELGLTLANAATGANNSALLVAYDGNGLEPTATAVVAPEAVTAYANSPLSPRRVCVAVDNCTIYAYYVANAGPLTAGGIAVYAWVATPL